MTTSTAESAESGDVEILATAAPFVFLLVAAADGKVDKKELKQFSRLLADERFSILAGAMASAGAPIEQLLPRLREGGVSAVSANGVLGDPTGATATEGARLLGELVAHARRVTGL